MKNARLHAMILLTCTFAAFILGLFAGRNVGRTPVQIRSLPAVTTAATEEVTANTAPTEPLIIDLNTATSEQLQTLPGIGPVIAERIVAYREEYGAYETVGELMNVEGVGEKKLEAIWDLVTVGG